MPLLAVFIAIVIACAIALRITIRAARPDSGARTFRGGKKPPVAPA